MGSVVTGRNRGISTLIAALVICAACLVTAARAEAVGGTVVGWGYNASGQVGNGAPSSGGTGCSCVLSPTPLIGVSGVTGLAGGYEFGLALRSDGTVMSWGYNSDGELGDGTTDLDAVPKPVDGVSNAIAVAAGSSHALVLLADGTLLAWGRNQEGELGLGSAIGPDVCNTASCAKRPVAIPGVAGVIAIAASEYHSLALLADGTVIGWGSDENGAMGTGSASANPCKCAATPVAVPAAGGAVAISAGDYTGAALLPNGSVLNWGRNSTGELGTGTASPAVGCGCLGPVSPAGLSDVRQISAGGRHSVALLGNDSVRAWGYNYKGQVGNGTENKEGCHCVPAPSPVPGLAGPRKVEAGDEHSIALLADGTLMGWGDNEYGLAGPGSTSENRTVPVAIPGVSGASDAIASDYNTYAILGPSQNLSIAFAGAGSGTVGGDGILCSSACSEPFAQGQVKGLRAVPSAAGQFAGWSGPCTGIGVCQVRLDADQTVTATFGPPVGTRITKLKLRGKRKKRAQFTFTAPGAVTGFQCLLRRPAPKPKRKGAITSVKRRKPHFANCASGKTYKKLGPGKYTFKVRALNILGADATPAKRTFKVRVPKRKR